MRIHTNAEFWFASTLSFAAAAQAWFLWWLGRQVFPLHGHEAFLEIIGLVLVAIPLLITCSCSGWEWLLLRRRVHHPEASLQIPTVVFCVGVAATLFCIGWWSVLI
jgi:hypothetical protein